MIIYWVLIIGIFVQATTCEDLEIDESVLTAEEEEVSVKFLMKKKTNRKSKRIVVSVIVTPSICTDTNASSCRRSNRSLWKSVRFTRKISFCGALWQRRILFTTMDQIDSEKGWHRRKFGKIWRGMVSGRAASSNIERRFRNGAEEQSKTCSGKFQFG